MSGLNRSDFLSLQAQAPTLPIMVLSGLDDEKFAFKAVQEGARDYLMKNQVNGSVLVRSLRLARGPRFA